MIEAIDLWSTTIFCCQYEQSDELNPLLEAKIEQLAMLQQHDIDSGIAPKAKHNLKESPFNLLDDLDPSLQQLRHFLQELTAHIAGDVNQNYWPEGAEPEANIVEAWYHLTENGGYHDVHNHPNCSWCGIYYIDAAQTSLEDKNGVNRFYDPRVNAGHYRDAGTAYLDGNGVMDFAPQAGQVIIFPSYLMHSALPYFGKTARKLIAFNAQVFI